MRFLFVVHKNEEKAEQNSVLFHRLTLKERGLRPNGYFPLMRQPLCFVSTVRLGCLLGIPAFLNRELNSQLMFLLNKLKDFHFNLSEKPEHINVFDFIALADIWNFYSFFAIRVVSLFCNDYILMCQSVRTNP